MRRIYTVVVCVLMGLNLCAQNIETEHNEAVKTIDGIVSEMLEIISGDTEKVRDWEAFRNLFTADVTFSTVVYDKSGKGSIRCYTLEEFVRVGQGFYQANGFVEYELKKEINQYNGIAHVFQSYVAKFPTGKQKGINSYQLMFDGSRWWISSVVWASNSNGVELPKEFE